jgi:8-amino-7-oxononanoate synthase
MNSVEQHLNDKLKERAEAGNLRRLPASQHGIDFRSNDYLGFAASGKLSLPVDIGVSGATGSRLISGNSALAEELEQSIAVFHQAEAALLFNSGYDANIGLLSSVADRHTTYIYDELCHASILDGIRLAICRNKFRFAHNNTAALQTLLESHSGTGRLIVVVEAVYSMDGDIAPLQQIVDLCEAYGAELIVDEAHATGVLGAHGEGLVCSLGLAGRVMARVHTFGKALGCHGAVVVGSTLLRNYLINFARSFIYTTALPPHSLLAIQQAYELLQSPHFSNTQLHNNIARFGRAVNAAGITAIIPGTTPIQTMITGGNEGTRRMAADLQQAGLLVNPILHPTVPLGMERLRICLHSFNTPSEIDLLINKLSA